jgi:hypothetical protein
MISINWKEMTIEGLIDSQYQKLLSFFGYKKDALNIDTKRYDLFEETIVITKKKENNIS